MELSSPGNQTDIPIVASRYFFVIDACFSYFEENRAGLRGSIARCVNEEEIPNSK